jgi:3-hydroxyisobutyrate dehydrogenase-like beta-hydroxyacid dehydrogenase
LTIMVGRDAQALEGVRPVLLAVGKTITHVGGSGAGQVAKACNQIMVAAQMVAMGSCSSSRGRQESMREGRRNPAAGQRNVGRST